MVTSLIRPGDVYEDCAFHPVFCVSLDVDDDEITGISLIDGSTPRSCSLQFCGVEQLTLEDVVAIKRDFAAYVAKRQAEVDAHNRS